MPTIDHHFKGNPVYKWTQGSSHWLACPEWGAKLWSWTLHLAGGRNRPIIYWPDDPALMKEYAHIRGGNPILFPFSGRTFHQGHIEFWKPDTQHEVLPMPMHGFAKDGKFTLIHMDENGFHVRLLPTEEDQKAYPYQYDFDVQYVFHELRLEVKLILHNKDHTPIPWSAGHHFYFAVPWSPEHSRADYEVDMDARKAWRHATDGTLASIGRPGFPLNTADPEGLDRIHTKLRTNRITLSTKNHEETITLYAGEAPHPQEGLTVVTWSEDTQSPFYCVEPWMGAPNSPEHKLGLHFVPPGESATFHTEIRLDD